MIFEQKFKIFSKIYDEKLIKYENFKNFNLFFVKM